jgi:hypothetical protein
MYHYCKMLVTTLLIAGSWHSDLLSSCKNLRMWKNCCRSLQLFPNYVKPFLKVKIIVPSSTISSSYVVLKGRVCVCVLCGFCEDFVGFWRKSSPDCLTFLGNLKMHLSKTQNPHLIWVLKTRFLGKKCPLPNRKVPFLGGFWAELGGIPTQKLLRYPSFSTATPPTPQRLGQKVLYNNVLFSMSHTPPFNT